jgi:hypothetical protein
MFAAWEDSVPFAYALGGLHLLLALSLVPALRRVVLDTRLFALWLAGGTLAVPAALWVARAAPTSWFFVLREGFSIDHLRFVVGLGLHRGPLVRTFWAPLVFDGPARLRDVVALNVGASVAFGAWSAAAIFARTGSAWAATLLPVAFLAPPISRAAILGETEAPLCWVYLCLGWWAGWGDRRAGVAAALANVGLLVTLRPELAVLPAAAIVSWAVGGRFAGAQDAWRAAFDRGLRWAVARPALAAMCVAVWLCVAEIALPSQVGWVKRLGAAGWPALAADPLNDRALLLGALLLAVFPIGAVTLIAAGALVSTREPVATGFAAPIAFWLFGTWYFAGHGVPHGGWNATSAWELYRYMIAALPLWLGLAALGWEALGAGLPPWARVTLLLPPAAWMIDALSPAVPARVSLRLSGATLPSAMYEGQLLANRFAEQPGCAIVTMGAPWSTEAGAGSLQWAALSPRGRGWSVATVDGATPLADALPALVQGAGCAVAFRSLDCAADGLGGCGWLDSLTPLREHRVPFTPYVHPEHGMTWSASEVLLGWYRIPGVPADRAELEAR